MLFYESGRKGYLIMDTSGKTLNIGYHIPGEMDGLWFPPLKLMRSMKIEDLKKPVFVFSKVGKYIKDGETLVKFLIPLNTKELFINFSTNKKLSLTFQICLIPIWGSQMVNLNYSIERIRKMNDTTVSVEINGLTPYYVRTKYSTIRLTQNRLTVRLIGKDILYIGKEKNTELLRLMKLREKEKEEYYDMIGKSYENSIDFWMKRMLVDMYLSNEFGKGCIAGFPEYPWWFGIDTFFIGRALIKFELYDIFKDSIQNLLKFSNDGIIPHEIISNGYVSHIGYPLETLLLPILLKEYFFKTNDVEFTKKVYSKILKGVWKLLEFPYPKGPSFVEYEEISSNDIQCLDSAASAYACCRSLLKLSKALNDDKTFSKAKRLTEYYEKNFMKDWFSKEKGVFYDYFKGERKIIRLFFIQMFPLFLNVVNGKTAKLIFKNLKRAGLINEKGLLHSLNEDTKVGFYGGKSHKVWWIANAILKQSIRNYNLRYDLSKLDKKFIEDVEKNGMPHVAPEIMENQGGCFAQTWSVYYWTM